MQALLDLDEEKSDPFSQDADKDPTRFDRFGPAPYPQDDDAEDHVFVRYTEAFVEEQVGTREAMHRMWQQNLLMLMGQQWLRYDPMTGTFSLPKMAPWKQRPVSNVLKAMFKTWLSKVTKNRPVMLCAPASTDTDDTQAAELGQDVLHAKWIEIGLGDKYRRACAWVYATGNVFTRPLFSYDTGRIVPVTVPAAVDTWDQNHQHQGQQIIDVPADEDGNPKMTEHPETGAPMYDTEAEPAYIDEGEVDVKVVSPFNLFVNIDATHMDEVTSLVEVEPLTEREFYRRYPDAPTDLAVDDAGDADRFEALLGGLAAGGGPGGADTYFSALAERDEAIGRIKCYHYFERPCVKWPQGRYWMVAGGALVIEPTTLPDELWPQYHHLGEIDVPGHFWKAATVTDVVGLQREYNDANAFIKEHHNLLLRGKWLVPIGSNIQRGQITTEPGEVIQHTPGLEPKMADLKPLPEPVYLERDRIMKDIQMIAGVYKVSMGEAPPGVTSGKAFLVLQEADDTDLGPFLTKAEEWLGKNGLSILRIIQKNYDDERMIRISGATHSYRIRSFRGANLEGVSSVEVQQGSMFPWNQVAKQDMMMEALTSTPQLFMDHNGQLDLDNFKRLLPIGGIASMSSSADDDVSQAHREEEMFEMWDGMTPMPVPLQWQNHAVHLKEHTRVLNSAGFEKWPPECQQAFIQHWMLTQQAVQQMQMQAMMMQEAAAQGAGAPGKNQPPSGKKDKGA